jgi:hypothetical protein
MASGQKPNPGIKYFEIRDKLLRPSLTSTYNVFLNPSYIIGKNDSSRKFFKEFRGIENDISRLLTISCSEASLPGSSFATHEINNDYSGVTERHVYRRLYDDRASFTFYVNSDYQVIKFFETWMSWIVGEDQYKEQSSRTYNYRVKFPNDYKIPSMHIQKYERDYGKKDSKFVDYTFIDAYPVDISSMPMSYDSSNLMKCTVSFVYTRYYMENISTGPEEKPSGKNPNAPGAPEFYGPGLPGERADELRRALEQDAVQRDVINNPNNALNTLNEVAFRGVF